MKWIILILTIFSMICVTSSRSWDQIDPRYITLISFPADQIKIVNRTEVPGDLHALCGWWNTSDCDYYNAFYVHQERMRCHLNSDKMRIVSSVVSCNMLQVAKRYFPEEIISSSVYQDTCELHILTEDGSSIAEWNKVVVEYGENERRQIIDARSSLSVAYCGSWNKLNEAVKFFQSFRTEPDQGSDRWNPKRVSSK